MPNRTIYIADTDLPIYEEAQRLAGDNLSATIVKALKNFINSRIVEEENFQEITVKVGRHVLTQKRFFGRLLAQGFYPGPMERWAEWIQVYLTRKGAIVLYRRTLPDSIAGVYDPWEEVSEAGAQTEKVHRKAAKSIEKSSEKSINWQAWRGEFILEVFDELEKIRGLIPAELLAAAEQNLTMGPVEFLDI